MAASASSVLTEEAIREIGELVKASRRQLAEFYREHRSGMTLDEIARLHRDPDLKRVKGNLNALRVLFGRESLPKRGNGRQQVINEAEYWLKSEQLLSEETTQHFEKLLYQAEKTNTRRRDFYEPPLPPTSYSLKQRPAQGDDYPGVYVLTRQAYLREAQEGAFKLKIGWSHKVWDRLASAQTWDPEPLALLRIFPCSSPNVVESRLHIVLDTLNLGIKEGGGIEWFTTRLELIDEASRALGLANELEAPRSVKY